MLRHIALEDGKIYRLVHYFEYEAATRHPEAVVTIVGFPAAASYLLTDASRIADPFFDRYFDAWSSGDLQAIAALYDPGASRTDALLGSVGGDALRVLVSGLLDDWPALSLERGLSYINGWGCAAAYTIDLEDCSLPAISIFELTTEGTIAAESVYYDADSARQCEWESS